MSVHEKIDPRGATPVDDPAIATSHASGLRDAPGYSAFFGLAEDGLWRVCGNIAAAFVALTTLGVLIAIGVAVAG